MVARWPTDEEVDAYVAERAVALGIDPMTAIAVRRGESGGANFVGDYGSSFGPFQLHYGGIASGGNSGSGMGNDFTKDTGLNARDPSTWKQQVDYALAYAQKNGWGPFHAIKRLGIDIWAGIKTAGIDPTAVGDQIGGGIRSGFDDLYSGVLGFVQDRSAAIVLTVIAIVFLLAGVWGIIGQSEVGKQVGTVVASKAIPLAGALL